MPVLYVTEHAVFELTSAGLVLTEVEAGLDVERDVLAAGDDLFVSGDVADDDGDGGRNLLVRRYRLRDGVLLWEQELEAPNPKQDMVNTLHNSENLAVAGAKLMVWSGTTGSANPSVLLRLDRDSGTLLPPAP